MSAYYVASYFGTLVRSTEIDLRSKKGGLGKTSIIGEIINQADFSTFC